MQHLKEVGNYYEALAPEYDDNRFGNTYGQFIHQQENALLQILLGPPTEGELRLDLGCGTGRLLHFGSHGLDYSTAMVAEASKKHPTKEIHRGSATEIPFPNEYFSAVYSFHLLMHLGKEDIPIVLKEVAKILHSGGRFIFDIPSAKRRQLTNYQAPSWHAAQSLSIERINEIIQDDWQLLSYHSVLFLPIHRFPVWLRGPVRWLDNLLCRSPWREYASYLVIEIQKK